MQKGTIRGAVVAAAVVAAAAGVSVISSVAAGSSNASSFVPMTPCRLFDTRPAPDNIGARAIPLGAGDVFTVDTWGTNGNCTIPTGATALSLNVVAIGPTASSYLTVYPGGTSRPTASSLNWTAGQAPTPNAVTATLSGTGQLSFFNLAGSVDIAADVVGYYEPSTSGPAGPAGPPGAQGAPGVDPANIIWVASSGGDFTTVSAALASISDNDATHRYLIKLAPGTYTENNGIDMKNYVDIEGSGLTSVISSTGSGTSGAAVRFSGMIHAELRDVSVTTTGTRGVFFTSQGDPADARLTNASVTATGVSDFIAYAVALDNGRATISGVTAVAAGASDEKTAIDVRGGATAVIGDSTATVTSTGTFDNCYGVRTENSTTTLIDSVVSVTSCNGVATGVHNFASTATVDQVRITTDSDSGVNSDALTVWNSTATVDRVTATSTGAGTTGSGLYLNGATAVIRDSSFLGNSYGVYRLTGQVHAFDSVFHNVTSGMVARCTGALDSTMSAYTCA